jgi:hypothetical protein
VVDEALPPVFVQHVHVDEGDMGFAVLEHVELLLSQRLAAARLAKVWGAGAAGTVAALKRAIKALVRELFASADVAEALRCVRELAAPHFMHELVFRAMVLALDRKEREIALAARLIADARREGVLLHRQLEMVRSCPQLSSRCLRADAATPPARVCRASKASSRSCEWTRPPRPRFTRASLPTCALLACFDARRCPLLVRLPERGRRRLVVAFCGRIY